VFGLVAGLAYWNALIAAYAIIPALIWYLALVWRRRRGLLSLSRLRLAERSPIDIALLSVPVTC